MPWTPIGKTILTIQRHRRRLAEARPAGKSDAQLVQEAIAAGKLRRIARGVSGLPEVRLAAHERRPPAKSRVG